MTESAMEGAFAAVISRHIPTILIRRPLNCNIWIVVVLATCTAFPMRDQTAQATSSVPAAGRNSCTDTVSMVHAVPSVVYIQATIKESTDPRVGKMADIFAQSVAQRLRLMLHQRGDTLPAGEPTITWRTIAPHLSLNVTAYRSERTTYTLLTPHFDSVAAAMLLHASRDAEDADEGVFWPSGMPGDSLNFGLSFALSTPGTVQLSNPERPASPVFSVMFPPVTPAKFIGESSPDYPAAARMIGATGVVIVEFQVDSTGHTTPGTAREIWGSTQKHPTGELLAYYNEFLHSVFDWLPTATFAPARVGGCPVSQLVKEPFTFSIRN